MLAASASTGWLNRVRAKRSGPVARAADRRVCAAVAHFSLAGERDAFTRSSGVVPDVARGAASISVGSVIENREAFEAWVRRLVPAGSQPRLIRQ